MAAAESAVRAGARFETTTPLLPHQRLAVAKLLPSRMNALFMDMGTGKSRTLLELACIRQDKWDRLFWFCPVTLKDTVRRQVLEHTTLTAADVAVWGARVSCERLPLAARVHIIGIESMSASNRTVLAYAALVTERSFVAVDESSYIKGHHSRRTQRITHMSERARYRAVLNGTPISQGVVDLYAQMRFLSDRILGYRSFWSFAHNHLEYEERKGPDGVKRRTGRIIASHNEEWLAAKVAPYTYQVRKDECLTLPDKLYSTRWCRMTGEQRELYEQAKEEILLDCDYDDWSPIRIFRVYTALQGIVCGFWTRPDGTLRECRHRRLELLQAVLDGIPPEEPVIVWAKYHHAVDAITVALRQAHGPACVAHYHGGLSEAQRAAELQRWRAGSARYLVATQAAGGHGLTLNEAAYTVFYADGFKYSERLQAEDRCHRIGQARRPVYISLRCEDSIDTRIAAALERKGDVLEEFQSMVQQYRGEGLKARVAAFVRAL